jgi:hypothetical protein
MKVVLVSTHSPQPVGDGGTHRTYQIRHDLETIAGPANVIGVKVPPWWEPAPVVPTAPPRPRPWLVRGVRRVRRMAGRLIRPPPAVAAAVPPSLYTATPYLPATFLEGYAALLASLELPAVCVIEHSGFAGVMPINARYGLATWICAQNLEALETAFEDQAARGDWQRLASDLAHELRVLEQCSERLFISKVETGFVGGLGLVSHYYPYRPVGEIRARLLSIRQTRAATAG